MPPALRSPMRRGRESEVRKECEMGSGEPKAVAKRGRSGENQDAAEGRWKSCMEEIVERLTW